MCTCCNILIDVEINHDNKSHWTNAVTQHIFVGPDSSSGQPYSGRRSSVRQQTSGNDEQGLRPHRVREDRVRHESRPSAQRRAGGKNEGEENFFKNIFFGVSFGYCYYFIFSTYASFIYVPSNLKCQDSITQTPDCELSALFLGV
jgi:hypothetical protein